MGYNFSLHRQKQQTDWILSAAPFHMYSKHLKIKKRRQDTQKCTSSKGDRCVHKRDFKSSNLTHAEVQQQKIEKRKKRQRKFRIPDALNSSLTPLSFPFILILLTHREIGEANRRIVREPLITSLPLSSYQVTNRCTEFDESATLTLRFFASELTLSDWLFVWGRRIARLKPRVSPSARTPYLSA